MRPDVRTGIVMAVVLVAALAWGSLAGSPGTLRHTLYYTADHLEFSRSRDFDLVTLRDADLMSEVGAPQLPVDLVQLALPPGTEIERIEVNARSSTELPGRYHILPAQPPAILAMPELSHEPPPFVEPAPEVYGSTAGFPERVVIHAGTGYLGGYEVADILVYPLSYVPASGRLSLYTEIELEIHYGASDRAPREVRRRTETASRIYERAVARIVHNQNYLAECAPSPSGSTPRQGETDVYEYVIVTGPSYVSAFQPLADWKTKSGTPAKIVTTDWIYSNYQGVDNQDRIRNFIIDAYQNWSTVWVLLGGDTNVVPARIAFAMDCQAGFYPDENDLQCDLYYADLDGTWNANQNQTYGEVDDEVDLYPDVFVGRASTSSVSEAQAWVNKVLTYEIDPPTDYELNMLFAAEILWSNPYTDGGVAKDLIDDLYVPPDFDPITKLYERLGNESHATVMAALNEGQNVTNHAGHANTTIMSVGSGSLSPSDMDALTNHPRNGILYSIGCWPAAFDYDCIAEHFVNNPNGGGVAFIGNSRYGWGSPGNPEYGYSDRFDQRFYAMLFVQDIYHIGATLAQAKAYYAPRSHDENVYRWHQYQVNLLGEPHMAIWTGIPEALSASHPSEIVMAPGPFTVTATRGGEPGAGALVCVTDGADLYHYGYADGAGQITFDIAPATPDPLDVTVTLRNGIPYEGTVTVQPEGPYVTSQGYTIDDSGGGNGDGIVNPGETIVLEVTVVNCGTESTSGVSAVLSTTDPEVVVDDSTATFGDLDPAQTATGSFAFTVGTGCSDGHVIYFELDVEDSEAHSWASTLAVTVGTPVLICESLSIDDFAGNGNRILEPGEAGSIDVTVRNIGSGMASDVTGWISTSDIYVVLPGQGSGFGTIEPGSTGEASFIINVFSSSPDPHFVPTDIDLLTGDDYAFTDNFYFSIGRYGFFDDFEDEDPEWSHGGSNDLWHRSTYRSHSGSYSWYCGSGTSHTYSYNMDCSLVSPPVVLPPEATLSFWLWYDVAIYGVDGVYVEVGDGSDWQVYDFIGSGGALDSLYMGSDWLAYSYELEGFAAGDTVQVRFHWVSDDEDNEEGVYIDDVTIGCPPNLGPVTVRLFPEETVVAPGDSLYFTARVINNTENEVTVWALTEAELPNGNPFGPILGPMRVTLAGGQVRNVNLGHRVPAAAPLGTYTYFAKVGQPPADLWDEDSFRFTVE